MKFYKILRLYHRLKPTPASSTLIPLNCRNAFTRTPKLAIPCCLFLCFLCLFVRLFFLLLLFRFLGKFAIIPSKNFARVQHIYHHQGKEHWHCVKYILVYLVISQLFGHTSFGSSGKFNETEDDTDLGKSVTVLVKFVEIVELQ